MKLNPIPKIPRKWIRETMLNACRAAAELPQNV